MKKIISTIVLCSIVCVFSAGATAVFAQSLVPVAPTSFEPQSSNAIDTLSAFEKVIDVPAVDVLVPTVVALPLTEQVIRQEQFLVYERNNGSFIASYLDNNTVTRPYTKSVVTLPVVSNAFSLIDNNPDSSAEFAFLENGQNEATIIIQTSRPIDTSSLRLQLAQYVALPGTIKVQAGLQARAERFVVVAQKQLDSSTVTFPKITADYFEITLQYSQPLRINELYIFDDGTTDQVQQSLRFLAQPGNAYQVYYGADRPVLISLPESGNLQQDNDVFGLPAYSSVVNGLYVPADIDKDGVRDVLDNCVRIDNPDQTDINNNGRGDACDDFDGDGVINSIDNCVNQPNRSQADADRDGIGDVCDAQESRFTESNPWIPWVGIGTAIAVILTLFILVARGPKREETQ